MCSRLLAHKQAILKAASAIGIHEFRGGPLLVRSFCFDHISEADDAPEVAAKILEAFCIEDGVFNHFYPGVRLAAEFLDAVADAPKGDGLEQAFKDLKSILETNPTRHSLRGWATSHYR